jgi:hypothetical protein
MEKEDYKIYRTNVNEMIAYLRTAGNKVDVVYKSSQDDPQTTIRVHGCKKWIIGIWAIGPWSKFYMTDCVEHEYYIAVFAIHSWGLDKFRFSSADWGCCSSDYSYLGRKLQRFVEQAKREPWEVLRENTTLLGPNSAYLEKGSLRTKWEYLKAVWNFEISMPFREWLRRVGSPLALWYLLKTISYLDPKIVERKKTDYGSCCWPRYAFCFLCKKDLDIDKVYSAWRFYSVWPEEMSRWLWIKKNIRLFDAHWRLADQISGETDEEIARKMGRGIYFDERDTNDED